MDVYNKRKEKEIEERESLDPEERKRIAKRAMDILKNSIYLLYEDDLMVIQDLLDREVAKRSLDKIFWD